MRTKVPSSPYDAEIELEVSKKGQAWSFSVRPNGSRPISATGRLPSASRHTLIAVALTSALMAIHEKEWNRLRGDRQKPRIVIDVPDEAFIRALEFRRRSKAQPQDGFRVSRNLLLPLYRQLVRFDFELRFKREQKGKIGAEMTEAERMIRRFYSFNDSVFAPLLLAR